MKTYVVGQVPSGYAPLPPENVLINGARYPADISGQYTISWAPNPREHMYGPAVSGNETYTLRLYDETDTLRRTVTGITGNSYTWSTEAADSGFTDPYWSSLASLLHFDGADGSTTFTDEKGKTWTPSGNAQIDTSIGGFGGASGLFDGTGDYLSSASHADFQFGTGDFTVATRVRFNAFPASTQAIIFSTSQTNGLALFVKSSGRIATAKSGVAEVLVGATTLSTGVTYYIEASRSGTTTKIFVDGVVDGTATDSNNYSAFNEPKIGWDGGGSLALNGWLDEMRIIKGAAEHTANYTPPTGPSLGNVGRYNSSIRAELETVRGGVTSYQKQVIKTVRSVTTV